MSKTTFNQALDNVEIAYSDIIDIANQSVADLTGDLDLLIDRVYNNIEHLTNDDIRDTLLRLSLRAFSFSAIKDKAAFKATLAETLRKEAYAKEFAALDGTVSSRDTQATLNISNEIVIEHLYNLTAALFKTKLDQVHRCVDTLKTVLMSRLSEAKLCNIEG